MSDIVIDGLCFGRIKLGKQRKANQAFWKLTTTPRYPLPATLHPPPSTRYPLPSTVAITFHMKNKTTSNNKSRTMKAPTKTNNKKKLTQKCLFRMNFKSISSRIKLPKHEIRFSFFFMGFLKFTLLKFVSIIWLFNFLFLY